MSLRLCHFGCIAFIANVIAVSELTPLAYAQSAMAPSQAVPVAQLQSLPAPGTLIPRREMPLPQNEDFPAEEGPASPFQPSLPSASPLPADGLDAVPGEFMIREVVFRGNTAFSDGELRELIKSTLLEIETVTVADIYRAAEQINQKYAAAGYVTTGTLPQIFLDADGNLTFAQDGQVIFQVVEGRLEAIEVVGTERLAESYVRSRLELATQPPLNEQRLVDALQLLYDDPLIDQVDAVLDGGTETGTNILRIRIKEADSFEVATFIDNQRSPNVGTFQQGIQASEGNLFGLGDRVALTYSHTEGSNGVSLGYTLPLNPQEGQLQVNYSYISSRLITPDIADLDIQSTGSYLDLTWQQPLVRTPRQEFTVGVTGSYRQNQVVFGESIFGSPVGFPAAGANDEGRSQVTALRLFQSWVSRNPVEVTAVRSQLSLGLGGAFGGTVNAAGPDSRFVSWRGQAQYQRRWASDLRLSIRGDLQVASRQLLPVEQFGLGGQSTVRGYRQDVLLADNGGFASVEAWLPVARFPQHDGILYVTPFIDIGRVWSADEVAANSLAATGLGLRWQQNNVTALLELGIPLIDEPDSDRTWQEKGIHFSLMVSDW